uniref:Uncharacterized protein n=1 Tax=Arundo donax TaxID=35708 RepID=A0A0A9RKX6_ARUDO
MCRQKKRKELIEKNEDAKDTIKTQIKIYLNYTTSIIPPTNPPMHQIHYPNCITISFSRRQLPRISDHTKTFFPSLLHVTKNPNPSNLSARC